MRVKLVVLIVAGFIASLKVAAICWLSATPVAVLAGTVRVTVGAGVSGAAPGVKLQTKALARALPARPFPPVVTAAAQGGGGGVAGQRAGRGKVAVVPT